VKKENRGLLGITFRGADWKRTLRPMVEISPDGFWLTVERSRLCDDKRWRTEALVVSVPWVLKWISDYSARSIPVEVAE
jgi:hypothetical protein